MPVYEIAGRVISTPFRIEELSEAPAGPADWTVVHSPQPIEDAREAVFEVRTEADRLWWTLRGADGFYSLRFEDQVDFAIDVAQRTVVYAPRPGLADSSLCHLLIDQVVPHLLAAEGEMVLHASAVAVDGSAIAFIGPSGAGKSSLAAGWVGRGASLLADDFLLLREGADGYAAVATYPGLRLWADSADFFAGSADALPAVAAYSDKRRWSVPEGDRAPAPVPLRAIVLLGDPPPEDAPACRLAQLRGSDAFAMIYGQGFRIARSGRDTQQDDLERFTRLAAAVPVLYVEHRRDYEAIPQVIDGIAAALDEIAS